DLEKVTKIAKSMVNQYGMSEAIGPVQYDSQGENVFLGRDYTSNKSYSDTVAYEIDQEIRKIVNGCYDQAKRIISEHRKDLDNIVRALIDQETLTKEDLDNIVKYGKVKPETVEETVR
ncbi:MAG: cell division protein FtsH, partial [Erysipelotrichaceae bacterium]|nr:cell division protein FtsH [Erysipelotrichaceae bacterium]